MRGLLQIRPLHLRTFRTIILTTKGSRRHAAEIALIPHGEGPWKPRDNPLNLIRLGPAEGWFLTDWFSDTRISERLQPGERILWLGKPDPWSAARPQTFPLIFLTFWTAGILFAAWNVWHSAKPNQNLNFGLAVVGLMLFFGAHAWYRCLKAFMSCWHTSYALTDRRIIIAAGSDTQSLTAAALGDISRTGDATRGTLIFGTGGLASFYGRRSWGSGYANGLYGIENPVRVEALIYETLIRPKKKGEAG